MGRAFVHPEVLQTVVTEYNRLKARYPDVDDQTRWNRAKENVWEMALADKQVLMDVMGAA